MHSTTRTSQLALLLAFFVLCGELAQADGPLNTAKSVAGMKLYGELEAQVFALEPMISNPTNLTVDADGRVWLCDVINYRGNQGKRPDGDRILILEDEDGDGQADQSTVFYQGHDVDSALGICVLGDKVIVSCSPEVFILTDEDGDGRADKKHVLYTKTGDKQHDHTAHAFVFGPDGRLYWNIGNSCQGVFDGGGKVVVDRYGRDVRNDGKPYRHGMAFRQNLDGSNFEVIAHNLRNSYELTVDAFGEVWFTDNDDDGNLSTRLCFTLDGGNYGYTDERTGESWYSTQWTGMHAEVPLRHWHQNDPGSIPNVLNNGSGSPAGVEIYEADLLPLRLRGGIVHCEPGHNVVRVYLPTMAGGGYTAETIDLIDGRADRWFRPVDAATAPDGSLLVADWYDPGVGGHRQADIDHGRIYRVAPRDSEYRYEKFDLQDHEQACLALCSGNNSIRYDAWTALDTLGEAAEPALLELSRSGDPRSRARAYWLLTRLPQTGTRHLRRAASDADDRVRAAATRMTENVEVKAAEKVLSKLVEDPSSRVRRSVAIALRRYHDQDFAPRLWARLAVQFDGADRWYLEALGLAAEFHWDRYLDTWLDLAGEDAWRTPTGRMLIWRSRGTQTLEKLVALLAEPTLPGDELPRLFRAIDFCETGSKPALLIDLAESALDLTPEKRWFVSRESLNRLELADDLDGRIERIVDRLFDSLPRDSKFADLVMRFRVAKHYDELFSLAIGSLADGDRGVQLLRFLIQQDYIESLKTRLHGNDGNGSLLAQMLARTGEAQALALLLPLAKDSTADIEVRREAIRAMAANKQQAQRLVELAEAGQLEASMQTALVFALRASPWTSLSQRVDKLYPEIAVDEVEQLPVAEWMKISGSAARGEKIFAGKSTCATCHKVAETGKAVGPALTEIGSKLSRTGLYESILYPSAAISHNYESYVALTDEGTAIKGVLVNETAETVTLKTDKAVNQEFRRDELEEFSKMKTSLMPDGLHKLVTPQELADLVSYLEQLKKKTAAN